MCPVSLFIPLRQVISLRTRSLACGQQVRALFLSLPPTAALRLQACMATSSFYVGSGNSNSVSHA